MSPTERRRIAWGDSEYANLDPFRVDMFGRVFNADAPKPIDAIDRVTAIRMWREHGDGVRGYAVDASKPWLLGKKLPSLTSADLLGRSPDLLLDRVSQEVTQPEEVVTRWLHTLRGKSQEPEWSERNAPPPVQMLDLPPEWLPLTGDPEDGWFAAVVPDRFVSVFHGPSIAGWVFGDNSST